MKKCLLLGLAIVVLVGAVGISGCKSTTESSFLEMLKLVPDIPATRLKVYISDHAKIRESYDIPLPSPDADDEERAKREHKSPDFSCGFYDNQEVKPEKSAKFYVIECKRLGFPSGKWVLNKNYVVYGICRFVEPEWGYGKSVSSSAMIGYVQSMELEDILAEVNKEIEQNMLPAIGLSADGWEEGGISQLEQSLNRLRIPPGRFRLRHIWVDLRGKESQN